MKDFFQFREELNEGTKTPGSLKSVLNDLQGHWNDNAKEYLKRGIYPMYEKPFDRIQRGGVLTIGINPGLAGGLDQKIIKNLSYLKNKAHPVFVPNETKNGGTWLAMIERINSGGNLKVTKADRSKLDRAPTSSSNSKFDIQGKYGDSKNWMPTMNAPKRPTYTSEKGHTLYHANLNKMLEDIGMEDLISEMMWSNWVPFASKGASVLKAPDYKLATLWITKFIRVSNPKLIVVPISVLKKMQSYMNVKKEKGGLEIYNPNALAKQEEGKKTTVQTFYTSAVLSIGGKRYPIIGLGHWSSARSGGPLHPAWKVDANRDIIAADIQRLMKGQFNEFIPVKLKKSDAKKSEAATLPVETEPKKEPAVMTNMKDVTKFRDSLTKGSKRARQFQSDAKTMTFGDLRKKYPKVA